MPRGGGDDPARHHGSLLVLVLVHRCSTSRVSGWELRPRLLADLPSVATRSKAAFPVAVPRADFG